MTVQFVAVRKDEQGMITHFQTDDGRTITFDEARALVQRNEVTSLTEIYEDGRWEMDLPNSPAEGANLDDLPTF